MKMKMVLAALTVTLVATQAAAQSSCLVQSQIYNWDAPDNKTLIVEDNLHNKFKVSLLSECIGLTFKQNLGFDVFGGMALSCVSPGDNVIAGDPTGPQHCAIKSVEPYTPAMEKADKAAAAAKAAAH